jgi:hypothetical protein
MSRKFVMLPPDCFALLYTDMLTANYIRGGGVAVNIEVRKNMTKFGMNIM